MALPGGFRHLQPVPTGDTVCVGTDPVAGDLKVTVRPDGVLLVAHRPDRTKPWGPAQAIEPHPISDLGGGAA